MNKNNNLLLELKNNLVIWIIGIIAIFIIVLFIFYNKVINNNFFSSILNLSFSYLAAVMFYIGQIVVPNNKKRKKALLMLQPDIYNLYDHISFFIAFSNEVLKFNQDELIINRLDGDFIYYKYTLNDTNFTAYKNFRDYFYNFNKILKNYINNLQNRDYYKYLPDELIDIIAKIDMEKFLLISAIGSEYPICKRFSGLEKNIENLKEYQKKIKPFINKKHEYSLRLLNDNEKEKYKNNLKLFHNILKK